MIWGCQWDATLRWFQTSKDEEVKKFPTNSTGKGNYVRTQGSTNKAIPTGSNTNYKVNNIYDLAGNVYEWTLEAYSNKVRVYRGRCLHCGNRQLPSVLSWELFQRHSRWICCCVWLPCDPICQVIRGWFNGL